MNAAARDFEVAVDAVVAGDLDALRSMLRQNPALVRERSARPHHATLLHYIAANGVEQGRQRTPPNAVAVARLLLDAGAEVDALADVYDGRRTTLSLLLSSAPPFEAGLQTELAETLVRYGAALDESAVLTALAFGYYDTAVALARRLSNLSMAPLAGLGASDDVARLLPHADAPSRHVALALAAQHGQTAVLQLLLDAGEDPSRYNPPGFHAHSTPLHQAVWANHLDAVRLLVGRGARTDLRDKLYSGTPLDWAIHGNRTAIADYLRGEGGAE